MEDVNEKQITRLKFINKLYDEVDGDADHHVPSMNIGRAIGITTFNKVESIIHYLADKGLVEIMGFGDDDGPPIALTHQGVVEIEQARINPQVRTEHFPPIVNIINVQQMHNSQIQQGTTSSTQTQINKITNIEIPIRDLISQIERSSCASEDQKELARTYADILISQSKLPSETRSQELAKKTWEKLSNLSTLLSLTDYALKAAPFIAAFFGFHS